MVGAGRLFWLGSAGVDNSVRLHPGDDGDDNEADRPLPAQVQADTESGAVVVITLLLQMGMEELRRHFALAGANS